MALSSKKVVISSDGLDWTTHHQTLDHHQFPKQQQPLIRRQHQQQNQPEQLKCPRCDSSNTKFCYYNNYNKTQPRHFCKSCKRHWTKGGTLRNVPVGGGRKNKTHKSSKTTTVVTTAAAATRSTNHNVSLLNRVNSHPPLPIGGQKNLSEILYRAGLITPASASSSSSSSALQQNCVSNNSNGVLFGSNLSLPQSQSHDQGLNFSYPNPFQSSNFSDYTGEPLEDSTITTTTTSSTVTLPWQTSTTDFWNWDDIDNLVSTTDLNIPWNDDPEIKP